MLKAAVVLAGMNIYAAMFIIPFTVVVYSATGGLKVSRVICQQCTPMRLLSSAAAP